MRRAGIRDLEDKIRRKEEGLKRMDYVEISLKATRTRNNEARHLEEPSSARSNTLNCHEFHDYVLTYCSFLAASALTRPVSSASTDCWFAVRLVLNHPSPVYNISADLLS